MGAVLQDFGAGGGRCPDLRNLIQDGDKGEPFVWIRYPGDNPQDLPEPWGVPPQVGLLPSRDEAAEGRHSAVGIPAFGGGNVRNMDIGGGGICTPSPEYQIPVH